MAGGYDLYAGADERAALGLLERSEYGWLQFWEPERRRPEMTFMHFVWDAEARCIEGHLANANPMLKRLEIEPRATFMVAGPGAYIPSYWVDPVRGVPTSYYSWALLDVEVEQVRTAEAVRPILERMLARFQPEGQHPPMDLAEPYWQKLMAAITGVRMHLTGARSRFKYGQNRPAAVRRGIVEQLLGRGMPADGIIAEAVRARLPEGEAPEPATGATERE